ncbi:hypothetical protein NLU13_1843 [Sarocladium strictum]|uniref:SAC3/GANP/THP3 conserved domain-containing protein n=1 Tax=Sarocladium strictum TaxID=5046 RepID=A0AA39GRP9_SARSR|nr:hypothetical protein NLU13_1843 [Sarocladium strictum]
MIATPVASSIQMFSSSSQTTQRPSPFNPFATNAAPAKANPFAANGGTGNPFAAKPSNSSPFGGIGDATSNQAPKNPFAGAAAPSSDGASQPVSVLSQPNPPKQNPFASSSAATQPPVQASKPNGGFGNGGFGPSGAARPTPPRAGTADLNAYRPAQSNDPLAKKVYQQLRNDNISPPSWPSQPGNPNHKGEMAKFREKYEAYRTKVRASLTKAGLIDDPDQRKTLSDAIDFKGICEDMCPQYEQITRITEIDVHQPEKDSATAFPMPSRMVKKLARSAAGQEAPLPMDVRSIAALRRTFDYLIDDLLQDDSNLPGLHGFLWDRTRAIRRDFTFFSSLTPEELKIQVYVLENTARFHVTALHLLSQEGKAPEDFVEQQELEQLGKALLSLRDVYDDCNEQGITCENEPEFRAYYLIFHGRDSNIIETLQRQWRPTLWKNHDVIRTAVSLVEAMQSTQDFHDPLKDGPSLAAASAFLTYFKIVEDPSVSYTMACFAECHFPHIRRSILSAIKRGLARPKDTAKDVTAAVLNRFLRFDTVQQAVAFAELHDLEWAPDPEKPYDVSRQYLVLNSRQAMSHPRLSHQFSQSLVEKKRGSRSLPEIIHQSIFEDERASGKVVQKPNQEGSLFVQDKPLSTSPFATLPKAAVGPSSTFGPSKASPFATNSTSTLSATNQSTTPSLFAAPSHSATPTPFSSAVQQTESLKKPSPFTQPASTPSFSFETKPMRNVSEQKQVPSSLFPTAFESGLQGQKPDQRAVTEAKTVLAPSQSATTTSGNPPTFTNSTPAPNPFAGFAQTAAPQAQVKVEKSEPSAAPGTGPLSSLLQNGLPDQKATPSLGVSKPFQPVPTKAASAPTSQAAPSALSNAASNPSASAAGSSQAAGQSSSVLGQGSSISKGLLPAQPPAAAKAQLQKPEPPRDLMGDFTQWFLLGDQGLLDEFKAYMVEDMLPKLYDSFYAEQEEQRQREEEAGLLAEADAYRAYSLSMRYFYRWKEHAREKRLRTVRRQARDQARKFYEQQWAAEREARRKAMDQAKKERAHNASLNRPEELAHILKNKKMHRRQAEEAILSSGILSGIANEREVVADIVRREVSPSVDGSVNGRQSARSRSGSGSGSVARGGSKTRALREELLGGSSASFRRSLPSMSASARSSAEPEGSSRKSRVSERWRLKAMGITQMPDGTALPEHLANEILYGGKQYRELGSLGLGSSRNSARRASIGDSGLADSFAMPPPRSTPAPHATNEAGSPTKRKRSEEDEENERRRSGIDSSRASSHKRIMSGAEEVLNELRALRVEMEEGSAWFREQNERLQSEGVSRGTTPWEGSIS